MLRFTINHVEQESSARHAQLGYLAPERDAADDNPHTTVGNAPRALPSTSIVGASSCLAL